MDFTSFLGVKIVTNDLLPNERVRRFSIKIPWYKRICFGFKSHRILIGKIDIFTGYLIKEKGTFVCNKNLFDKLKEKPFCLNTYL